MIEITNVKVTGTVARCGSKNLPQGLTGAYITIEYADPMWNSLVKTVVFKGSKTIDVRTDDTRIEIPQEVLQTPGKRVYVGFYGTGVDETVIVPTVWAELGTIVHATDPSGDESTNPVLPMWAQLAGEFQALKDSGFIGPPGKTPEKGVDYFTPEEIAEIVEEIKKDVSGGVDFETDETLTLKDGILSVNTTDVMERDNTLPITSAGVYATVGNIEALLMTI